MGRGANEKSSTAKGATAALKAGATRPDVSKVRIGYPWPVHSFANFIYILPCLLAYCVYARMFPSILDVVIGFSMHFVLTLVPMSVILHRYFSHVAYSANRFTTFVLGVVSCLAYQYGPMWWSGKHRRHHRYCDQPEDPHSWGIFGLW